MLGVAYVGPICPKPHGTRTDNCIWLETGERHTQSDIGHRRKHEISTRARWCTTQWLQRYDWMQKQSLRMQKEGYTNCTEGCQCTNCENQFSLGFECTLSLFDVCVTPLREFSSSSGQKQHQVCCFIPANYTGELWPLDLLSIKFLSKN